LWVHCIVRILEVCGKTKGDTGVGSGDAGLSRQLLGTKQQLTWKFELRVLSFLPTVDEAKDPTFRVVGDPEDLNRARPSPVPLMSQQRGCPQLYSRVQDKESSEPGRRPHEWPRDRIILAKVEALRVQIGRISVSRRCRELSDRPTVDVERLRIADPGEQENGE